MMVVRGSTAHFVVSYDDTLGSGIALADAVLASCEKDVAALSALFGGIMPAAASLPFHINLVPGGGGASHPGCLATTITCFISASSDTLGVPALVDAEVAEVLMNTQAKGFDCGASNGEALSRVLPTVLYPNLRNRFSTGNFWLNSSRADWVSNTDPTDTNAVSTGCASLFLNYLAYQLNFSWPAIIKAAAPTLALTAANLGVVGVAFNDFAALLACHFPRSVTAHLPDDVPFPLAGADQPFQASVQINLAAGAEGGNAFVQIPTYKRLIIEYVSGNAVVPAGQTAQFSVFTSLTGATTGTEHLLLAQQRPSGGARAGQAVRLYADPGTQVMLRVDRDSPSGSVMARMSLSGRLVDLCGVGMSSL
jgi:hypothetical protein